MSVKIEKQESAVNTDDEEEDPTIRPLRSTREKFRQIFESPKFHVAIVCLVLIDCLIVVAELVIEAKHEHLTIAHILHYASIAILSFFMVEITLKLFAHGLDFFHSKLEVFDAIVVVLSFALDIAFWGEEGVELLIVLRLWRVARILNGVIITVQTQAEHKHKKEINLREGVERELDKSRTYCTALEQEVETLRSFLAKHNITDLPPSIVDKADSNHTQSTINVVVEVNQQKPFDT